MVQKDAARLGSSLAKLMSPWTSAQSIREDKHFFSHPPFSTQWFLSLHSALLWLKAKVFDVNPKVLIQPLLQPRAPDLLLLFICYTKKRVWKHLLILGMSCITEIFVQSPGHFRQFIFLFIHRTAQSTVTDNSGLKYNCPWSFIYLIAVVFVSQVLFVIILNIICPIQTIEACELLGTTSLLVRTAVWTIDLAGLIFSILWLVFLSHCGFNKLM